jgi:hypothetical protein
MWTVAGLAADLAASRTSSRELVEQSLARIADAAGEGPRAFLKVYAETARAEADLADRLRANGIVRSPVDGLPVSVKDLFDVGGDVNSRSAPPASIRTTARRATPGTGPQGASPAAPRRAPQWRRPMACALWRLAAIREVRSDSPLPCAA